MLENSEKIPTLIRVRQSGYRLYARQTFNQEQIDSFLKLVEYSSSLTPSAKNQALSGRVPMVNGQIEGIGNVVVKSYRRGGLLKGMLSTTHARMFETRCRLEYKILREVRSLKVNAPEPLAYIEEGEFLYQAWLVTKTIDGGVNLIDFVKQNPEQAQEAVTKFAQQVRQLILNGIHHVDLHPGNVVIDPSLSAWIVDFDKAYHYRGDKNKLRDRYLRRWRRAVIKHRLPEIFSEVVSLALREQF